MSDPPTPLSMERGGKGKTAIPEEEKADEPSILPMTPESKQLAAVIATAVATAMAGRPAPPDSSSSMVRYSAGVSLASRTRSIISIVRNLKLHLVTLPGANLASNELLLKLCKAFWSARQRAINTDSDSDEEGAVVGGSLRATLGAGHDEGAGGTNLTHNSDTEESMVADGTSAESEGRKRRRVVMASDSGGEEVEAEVATRRRRTAVEMGRLGGGGKEGWVT